jgi:glycyl-tRNA synthetase
VGSKSKIRIRTGRGAFAGLTLPRPLANTRRLMAEPKENVLMEKIVSLCKRRGFIYQSSEIYGGINGFWDYGPMGAELKRNVKETWWNTMTRQRDDVVGLDATIIMNPAIWRASGHVDTFSDPMCDCLLTKKRFRADQIEPQSGVVSAFHGAVEREDFERLATDFQIQKDMPSPPSWIETFSKFRESASYYSDESVFEIRDGDLLGAAKLTAATLLDRKLQFRTSWENYEVLKPEGKPPASARKTAAQFYQQRGIKDPLLICGLTRKEDNSTRFNPENGSLLTEPRPFNLMFHTFVGASEPAEKAYLRPETAQAIFAQFKNVLETSRQKVPFGIAQIGKAFRNEVTPRNFTFRSREFEQMELEFFIKPDEAIEAIHGSVAVPTAPGHPGEPQPNWGWQLWHQYWVEERIRYYESIGLPRQHLKEYWQTPEELAHYARATVDILYTFPFSKRDENGELKGEELEGVAARSDFDLSQHQRFSGKPMGVFDEELKIAWAKLDPAKQAELSERYYQSRFKYLTKTGEAAEKAEKQARADADGLAKGQYIPHVIEPSAGADRLILALISDAFHEEETVDEKSKKETITKLKFHPRVAPIKAGVYPLLKNKPDLVAKAKEVRDLLRPHLNVFYDESGSIGRRYARADEIGTPFGITIDFDTLGEKGPELQDTVTLRHRDDGRQERVKISELLGWLLERVR